MFFSKYLSLLALPILAAATPMPGGGGGSPTTTVKPTTTVTITTTATSTSIPASDCSTGDLQCCQSVEPAGSSDAAGLLGLLGVVVQDLDVPVGLTCDPISAVGLGGASCSAAPVCCEDNSYSGLVAIGCVPVDLSL